MSYWETLAEAIRCLEKHDFAGAERLFLAAREERERSPGRVFLSEKLPEGWRRLWGGLRGGGAGRDDPAGRWSVAAERFVRRFHREGETAVREALRISELPPAEEAEIQQVLLLAALHLLTRSRLFPAEPTSAAPLLKALFRVVLRTAQPFDPQLLRPDFPLTEDDRLWLARKGDDLLETCFEGGADGARSERREWARALLQLLDTVYFDPRSRHREERAWLEAHLTDRHAGDPGAAVERYRRYLAEPAAAGVRADLARVRCLERLGNVAAQDFPVPRYEEALAAAGREPLDDPAAERRRGAALRALAWRRPDEVPARAWASLCLQADGNCAAVLWWDDSPRDAAFWRPGQPPEPFRELLAPCADRLVWAGRDRGLDLAAHGAAAAPGWPLAPFAEALLEPQLPAEGLTDEAVLRVALSRLASWREGWDRSCGHPLLRPPPRGRAAAVLGGEGIGRAVGAGLVWLAVIERLREADPALRDGLGELAGRGDAVAGLLVAHLEFRPATAPRTTAAGAGWPLPPLSDRPGPRVGGGGTEAGEDEGQGPRPDLTGNRVAIVSTGRPAAVLAAWGAGARRWRAVLDRTSRGPDLLGALGSPDDATLLPADGRLHARETALDLLEELLASPPAPADGLRAWLPLLHWIRLVETHNGDLLDILAVRPRRPGALPLHDAYGALVARLPRIAAGGEGPGEDVWAAEYRERARRARLVAGPAPLLAREGDELDALWGVERGGDAAWIFLDTCGVHWRLRESGVSDMGALHDRLAARGERHLSLVLGGGFLWELLEDRLAGWLEPYGPAYGLALRDARPAFLHLAVGGVAPDARVLALQAGRGQLRHAADLCAGEEAPLVLLPPAAGSAPWWRELAAGRLPWERGMPRPECLEPAVFWAGAADAACEGRRLLVPVLASLGPAGEPAPEADPEAWAAADRRRRDRLLRERGWCALEINALLASGAEAVDVADPRWWRRFPLARTGAADQGAGDAAAAGALVSAEGGRPYDLEDAPGPAAGRMRRAGARDAAPWDDALRGLLHATGRIGPDGRGSPAGLPDAAGASDPGAGRRLHLDSGQQAWRSCAAWLSAARERGRRGDGLLLVAERPPAGAAELLAALASSGFSVCGDAGGVVREDGEPGPLVWLRPADFGRGRPPAALAGWRPTAVFGGDLRGWLPGPGASGLAGAAVLSWIAGCEAARVDLFTSALPRGWAAALRDFWEGRVGGQLVTGEAREAAGSAAGARGFRVAVGRLPALELPCPACGAPWRGRGRPGDCRTCGLDLARWLPAEDGEAAVRSRLRDKLAALRGRADLGAERPLHVWLRPAEAPQAQAVLRALGLHPRQEGGGVGVELADGRRWHVGSAAAGPGDEDGAHALLFPPEPDAPWLQSDELRERTSLWYRESELDGAAGPDSAVRVERLFRLLGDLGSRLRPGDGRRRELVPLGFLEALSGLPATALGQDLRSLRWLATLAGELEPAGPEPATEEDERVGLWLERPFLEIEHETSRLAAALDLLVPLLLASTRPGLITLCDLATLPARVAEEDLARLDRFLLASSGRLMAPPGVAPGDGEVDGEVLEAEILYRPVAGLAGSSRREVGYLGSVGDVTARLRHHLDLCLAAVQLLLTDAEGREDGWWVDPRSEGGLVCDPQLLELGWLLEWWRWCGQPVAGGVPRSELERLAATGTVRLRPRAAGLLDELAGGREVWAEALRRALPLGLLEIPTEAESAAAPRTPVATQPTEVAAAAARVAAVAASRDPALLVLRGVAGSGRLTSLLAGLRAAVAAGHGLDHLTLHCPDPGTAARCHQAWREWLPDSPPPLVVAASGPALGAAGSAAGAGPSQADRLGVMLEAQRFPTEERYRIAQHHRHGGLLVLLDPAEVTEPWEHLLLTTPREEDVVDMTVQLHLARMPWREVRGLAADTGGARQRARRREKGSSRGQWAANLDECLACLEQERKAGRLGELVDLTAPQADDLVYLGRRLAAAGWLPVYRRELDALLLPGPCEFLALIGDTVAPPGSEPALAPWLPPAARVAYRAWLEEAAGENWQLQDLFAAVCRRSWAGGFLAQPAARRRLERLLADVGEETPQRFLKRPLWEAWRRTVGLSSPVDEAAAARPLVTLGRPGPGGRFAPAGVYLCQGTEPARDHYLVLSRWTDRALVLYQDRSPLPGEAGRGRD